MTKWMLAGLAATAGLFASAAEAGVLSAPLEPKAMGKVEGVNTVLKLTYSSEANADLGANRPLLQNKGRSSSISLGLEGEAGLGGQTGAPLLNLEWDALTKWEEDFRGSGDGWGFGGSATISRATGALKPFVSFAPEVAFDDGSSEGEASATFEGGVTLEGEAGGVSLTLQPALQRIASRDPASRSSSEVVRFSASRKVELANGGGLTFKAKVEFQDADYDEPGEGMTKPLQEESLDIFVGIDVASWTKMKFPVLSKLAKFEIGAGYSRQDSNSQDETDSFREWRFAPTVKFAF